MGKIVQEKEYGYTTGSTATAAAKAAVLTLISQNEHSQISIDTPKGIILTMNVYYKSISEDMVEAYVYKNYSADPDVTKGIDIHVKATKTLKKGITLRTGIGIGIVTKKGLRVPVGEPAINPTPRATIISEVEKVLTGNYGVELFFTIPKGVEVAKKTFNQKLGIVGGISIIGTTGIVEPMSDDAYKVSLKIELNVKYHQNPKKEIYLVFGNFGTNYLKPYNISESYIQKTSNFIHYIVIAAKEIGFKKITLVGHAGKMVKVAMGIKNTHSKYGDNRMLSIVKSCPEITADQKNRLLECNTTDDAIDTLNELNIKESTFKNIGKRCQKTLEEWTNNMVEIEIEIFSTIHGELSAIKGVPK